jgi:hypothetical protein
MFNNQSTRQIDLHLPTGWNRCTTEELEAIAAAIIQEQRRVDRYHPFDWSRVKLNVALAVNHIEVVRADVRADLQSDRSEYKDLQSDKRIINAYTPSDGIANPAERHPAERHSAEQDEWLVRRPQDKEPWAISTGQLLALTDILSWVDDEKADRLIFQFPYPTMQVDGSGKTAAYGKGVTVQGPPPLLDGYTWREYRWMTDWMQAYMRHSNAKNAEGAAQAQREFLAILFKAAADNLGGKTAEHTVFSDLFTDFSPVKWQVILFWWSSLMSMLA